MDLDIEKIHELKYSEMQKLAKSVGIKANMKFDRLKTALIEYNQKENKENSNTNAVNVKTTEDEKETEHAENQDHAKDEKCLETKGLKGRRKAKSRRTAKGKGKTQVLQEKSVENSNSPSVQKSPKQGPTPTKQKNNSKVEQKKIPTVMTVTKKSPTVKTTPRIMENAKTPEVKTTPGSLKKDLKSKTPGIMKFDQKPKTPSFKPLFTSKDTKYTPLAIRNKNLVNTPVGSGQKRKASETTDTIEKPAKTTRMSFEKSELPSEPSPRSSSRRSTFSVEKVRKQDKKASLSPGVQDLVNAMDTENSKEEMKQNLIKALDKKVQEKAQTMDKKEKVTNSTQIPRFAAFLEKKRQEQKKPITPGNKDWTKIHQKEFEKFDSIDVYLEKKRKHREETNMSVKKARMLVEQTKEAIKRLQSHKTPAKENKPRKSKTGMPTKSPGKDRFQPKVFTTNQMNLNFTQTRKSPRNSGSAFKPTVTSTDKINLNFGGMKTPSNTDMKTPKTNPRKSTGSMVQRKSIVTPFKFTGSLNTTVDGSRSVKKPSFDLKASLSKPMTWKSHKGKLKSLNETYANNSAISSKTQASTFLGETVSI